MQCGGIPVLLLFILNLAETYQPKVCPGFDDRNLNRYYEKMQYGNENCTHINGDLEILNLRGEFDLSFLKEIREVTGYVFIWNVHIPRLVLPNLTIIRGRTPRDYTRNTDGGRFALLVKDNDMETLELPALREISAGNVKIHNNRNLCFMNTIKWEEIVRDIHKQNVTFVNSISPKSCPPCHQSCTDGCWGPGPLNCQKFSKINCSGQCDGGRCFGPNPEECCHSFCAGGCSGPTTSDCFACKNFNDSGACKEECSPMQMYNPATSSSVRNREDKYAYGATCVEECPKHLLRDSGACVESCPVAKRVADGECVPCGDGPCPRVCRGGAVLPTNIHRFQGCTTINGDLRINNATFEGYPGSVDDSSIMLPNALEVFSTLWEVTGFVEITANHPDFKNLSYFRNLELINGDFIGLHISETSLESLNLRSLRQVLYGNLKITNNPNLCFVSGIDWKQLMGTNRGYGAYVDISNNAAEDYCRERGLVCHGQCSMDRCWGTGPEECLSCESYKLNGTCVPDCNATLGFYDAGKWICDLCDLECLGECDGSGPTNCLSCRNVRDGAYCVSQCPVNKYIEHGKCMPCDENCVINGMKIVKINGTNMVIGPIIGGVVVGIQFFGVLTILAVIVYKRMKRKENNVMITMGMSTYEDDEPLEPSNVKPNLAKLIVIKESDLRKIGNLGCGAFGTVYKGLWIPEGENVKIAVAIKVLRDGRSPNKNKEILEEACITASVDHPNLLKLLGVCMASQIMLVTQLLPLGCLLDYVRSNKDMIGSKALLRWSSQIAKGMAYLEKKRMVHRDLALRNVLLKNPECIKITDFGMAKVLDVNEEEFKAEDGKMPIKWLALECFQHRIFTHKSDVWAFGVTVWELLTYGGRPYENISARKVPELIEKGQRLPQPSICSIEVYHLMLECWIDDAESRPTFTELVEQFSRMARDPDRYLFVDGDKHKKLPPFSSCAVKDLIEKIATSVDDSGVTVEAEEYLHRSYHKYYGTELDGKAKSEQEDVNTDPPANLPRCSESLPGCSSDGDARSEQTPHPHSVVAEAEVYTEKYIGWDPSSPVEQEDCSRPTSSSPDTTVLYVNLPGDAQKDSADVRPSTSNPDNPDLTCAQRHAMGLFDYLLMIDSEQPPLPNTDEYVNM